MNFFKSLLSPTGDVSSKRFSGLILIGAFIIGVIISYFNPEFTETAQSMAKTALYVGAGMLGANVVENVMTIVRNTPKTVEVKNESK